MKKNNNFWAIALIINIPVFAINLFLFTPMLVEQIKMGKGTMIEMGALIVWLINIVTLIPLIIGIIFTFLSISKDYKWRTILNFSLICLSIIMMVLTTLFMNI